MTGRDGALLGEYRIVRSLGSGPTGEVFLAEGPVPGAGVARVALKVLRGAPSDPLTQEVVRQTEAVAAQRLTSAVPHYGVVRAENSVAIVSAYAPAGSLGDGLDSARGGHLRLPLPVGVAARILAQLARALEGAHAAGLPHGDLKPNNIFVRTSPQGRPLASLGDFGQSGVLVTEAVRIMTSRTAPEGQHALRAATVLRYAAPEQLAGTTVPASDQYALATIAHELLTGEHPIAGEGAAFLSNLAAGAVTVRIAGNPDLSYNVNTVLARALSANPANRYASVAEFARALDDSLAASVPATGVTQQLAIMARSSSHPGASSVGHSGARIRPTFDVPGGESRPSGGTQAAPRLDRWTSLRKPLAIAAVAITLLALLSCGVSVFALNRGGVIHVPTSPGTYAGPDSATTHSTNTNALISPTDAKYGEAQLAAATAGQPTFSDTLASNTQGWQQNGTTVFFGPDSRLHIYNHNTAQVAATDTPGGHTASSLAISVRMSIVRGYASDTAGLRFLVRNNGDGTTSYYSFLISSDGHFDVWLFDPHSNGRWTFVTGGFSSAIATGTGASNTLSVLVQGAQGKLFVYANGHCIGQAQLLGSGPTSGTSGMMVMDGGAEATFTHYTLYTP